MTVVGAEPTSKTAEGRADKEGKGTLISTLPQEGKVSEQDGSSQRVSQARKGRRERREHWGEDRALMSPSLCCSVESHHKAAGNKTIQKAAGPCSGGRRATRDDQKDKGHGSPGAASRALLTKASAVLPSPTSPGPRTNRAGAYLQRVQVPPPRDSAGSALSSGTSEPVSLQSQWPPHAINM